MDPARCANDHFAAIYDRWNAENDYEMWLGEMLLPAMEWHGLRRGWALDVGCGTGRAFGPLLTRGWQLCGCDIAPRMLAEAARKFGSQVQLLNLDARFLPPISPTPALSGGEHFQLILLLNDVVNYLTEDGDLERLFSGVERNLSRDRGLVVLDANTLTQFRDDYASNVSDEVESWRWRGLADEIKPGAVFEGEFSGRGLPTHIHRQRHWSIESVKDGLEASSLRCLATIGQREQGGRVHLTEPPCEDRDAKVIYIATYGE